MQNVHWILFNLISRQLKAVGIIDYIYNWIYFTVIHMDKSNSIHNFENKI